MKNDQTPDLDIPNFIIEKQRLKEKTEIEEIERRLAKARYNNSAIGKIEKISNHIVKSAVIGTCSIALLTIALTPGYLIASSAYKNELKKQNVIQKEQIYSHGSGGNSVSYYDKNGNIVEISFADVVRYTFGDDVIEEKIEDINGYRRGH